MRYAGSRATYLRRRRPRAGSKRENFVNLCRDFRRTGGVSHEIAAHVAELTDVSRPGELKQRPKRIARQPHRFLLQRAYVPWRGSEPTAVGRPRSAARN